MYFCVELAGHQILRQAEIRDVGVFADSPPSWLEEDSKTTEVLSVTNKLNWEAFLDALGMKPLSPATLHRKVAGTILTIDLGWRLSSCDWWRKVCDSSIAHSYVEQRLKSADRVELTWLRQLRTPERVDVSELFLRSAYVRYGGHFLPYMDLPEESQALGCLQCLQVATQLNAPGLQKCLRVLQLRRCHDISVFADLYAALHALPKAEQSSTAWGSAENPGQFQVFLPPNTFEVAKNCLWTDNGRCCLRWLCGYRVLQSEYGCFGHACRSWLLGPHVGVRQDLDSLQASDFLRALRSLLEQADMASQIPPEERQKRLAGRDSPSAAIFLEELQSTAVQAYKHLAKHCRDENEEERSQAHGAIALAFQHEALIVLTDKGWVKPKRLKTHEAFWDVHPDLAGSKAANLALKGRLPPDDLDVLKQFFVDAIGIPESLTQQDLEARLRVPLSQEQPQHSSWQEGFGLDDFEDFATVRHGPGVLGPRAGEDEFFQPADAGYQSQSGEPGQAAHSGHSGFAAANADQQASGSFAPEPEARQDGSPDFGATGSARSADDATGPEEKAPIAEEQEEPEEHEEEFDWDGEDARDPYKVLGVKQDASDETIKRAYKKFALKYHPDKNRGSAIAQRRFQAIAAAYETLRDPEKRRAYDEAVAAEEHASRAQEQLHQRRSEWEPKVSAELARQMFQEFFGEAAALQAKRPRPATTQGLPAEAAAPEPSGKRKTKRVSKGEYNELLIQLKEAENTAKMWYDEVEAAREQLQEAEALRDRYLRILQQCYDRTSLKNSNGGL